MSAITADMQIILALLVFVTGLVGLRIPIIGLGGLMMGLIMIPYLDMTAYGLMALYVMACVVNVLFFIVGTLQAKKGIHI